jgi:ketopantoate hydroxymethyltransferase
MYAPKALEKKITLPYLNKLKQQGEKFACLTAYDYSFARLMDKTGVEVVLVGDSLGMVTRFIHQSGKAGYGHSGT